MAGTSRRREHDRGPRLWPTRLRAGEGRIRRQLRHHGEVGAAFSLYVGGLPVVDIWGGLAGEAAWQRGHAAAVFSTTKGATAICANLLAQRGQLDPDAPVARTGRSSPRPGRATCPCGGCSVTRPGSPPSTPRCPSTTSWPSPRSWRRSPPSTLLGPGTKHGYHALTYGRLVGEVVRRVTGPHDRHSFSPTRSLARSAWSLDRLAASEERRVAPLRPFTRPGEPAVRELMAAVMTRRLNLLSEHPDLNGALADRRRDLVGVDSTAARYTPPRCPPPTASRPPGPWPALCGVRRTLWTAFASSTRPR